MNGRVYIRGRACASAQPGSFSGDVASYQVLAPGRALAQGFSSSRLDPRAARRFSRVLRMSLAAAYTALERAEIDSPDAVLLGTGMGCLDDTAKFLFALTDEGETMLSATPFINSTHNTLAAQVAVQTGCKGFNETWVNRTVSFAAALDAAIARTAAERHVLLGGVDECPDAFHDLYASLSDASGGAAALCFGESPGEGAAFFVLSREAAPDACAIVAADYALRADPAVWLTEFLAGAHAALPDLVLITGDAAAVCSARHLVDCRDYAGSWFADTAFALDLAAGCLCAGSLPGGAPFDGRRALVFSAGSDGAVSAVLVEHA
jgi:hypothetical protein